MRQITFASTFEDWQAAARRALANGIPPEDIAWEEGDAPQASLPLFGNAEEIERETTPGPEPSKPRFLVPRQFMSLARRVACHRDRRRWSLMYQVLWRLTHGEPKLMEIAVDPHVHELMQMDKAVRHDIHKMRAFVRFRAVQHEAGTWYVAWFEPQHHIVAMNAPFFRDRFAQMHWSILTPEQCVHWDGDHLSFTPGVPQSEAPTGDEMEGLWQTYYGRIFNPARVKVQMMQSEMPKRYWKNLPEAQMIHSLLNEAPARVKQMQADSAAKSGPYENSASAVPPETEDWEELHDAAKSCRACPLWKNATQTVFGEGPTNAELVIVGEQPGDQEDVAGRAFVGPAGLLLNRALAQAGINRQAAYVTNAVKHFKWEPRGKRRLHKKPDNREIQSCRPWLEAELRILRPTVLLCLGGTAAASVFGRPMKVMEQRGMVQLSTFCERTVVTVHPSMLLRLPDEATRDLEYERFVQDLRKVAEMISDPQG